MTKSVILLFLVMVVCPEKAYAYLDPASGNAVVSFFVALFGSAVFFLKSLFYKIFARTSSQHKLEKGIQSEQHMPLIFSEGKMYWTTFRPIVEELIKQEVHFRYISLDVHDPGLMIDSVFMHSRRFNKNRLGFAKLANLEAPVMLSTTPNIGSDGYPMVRPAKVTNLVHVFHSMLDLSCYRKGSLDFYDTVLMTGAHEEHAIRQVEEARDLKPKALIVAGLPCLDDLERQRKALALVAKEGEGKGEKEAETIQKTILIAPSWGAKGCFSEYGTNFVATLAAANYRVIIRLHPHSHIFEPQSVEMWRSQTSELKNVVWDDNIFGAQAMAQADILISDTSSIRFDFVFLYKKPVISLPISQQSLSVFESDYMSDTWADTMSEKIGVVVKPEQLSFIDQLVDKTITEFTGEKLGELRDQCVANFGNSASVIVPYLKEQSELLLIPVEQRAMQQQIEALASEVKALREQLNQQLPS